jgi:hypothetical protein
MKQTPKLGYALVMEGLIDEQQLAKSLSVQKLHPTKSIGEIVSKLYNISEEAVESIFVRDILIPSFRNFLYSELKKKINTPDFDLLKAVPAIEIILGNYTRVTIVSKTFAYVDNLLRPSTHKNFLSKIDCSIKTVQLRTLYEKVIEFQDVVVEYDIQNQRITMENPSLIMEAKIRLNQIMKKG